MRLCAVLLAVIGVASGVHAGELNENLDGTVFQKYQITDMATPRLPDGRRAVSSRNRSAASRPVIAAPHPDTARAVSSDNHRAVSSRNRSAASRPVIAAQHRDTARAVSSANHDAASRPVIAAPAKLALAADMPINAQPFLPPRAVVYNPFLPRRAVGFHDWSGCYVGLQGGGGWGQTEFTNTINTTAFGDLPPGASLTTDHSGFIGGGQVGCNYQLAFWVFGVEGSFAAANIKGDLHNTVFGNPLVGAPDDVFTTKINSIGTVTGRVGYAWNNWLLYAKGGYAGANVEFSVSDTNVFSVAQGSGSETTWRSGWTAGTGLEYGITPNWIIGVEYDYINLGTASYEVGGSGGSYAFDVQPRIHQVVGRLSYKFGP